MNLVVKASAALVGAVGLFSIIFYLSGLHESFFLGQIVFLAVAIAINVAIVIWALSKTAADHTYGGQVGVAAGIGALGGLGIVVVSWLLLAVVFPDALAEMRAGAVAYMEEAQMPQAQVDQQMQALDSATPLSQSLPGGLGAFFTSLVTGAVYGFFRRKKN